MTDLFLTLIHDLTDAGELPAPYADRLRTAATIHACSPEWRTAAALKLNRDAIDGLIPADSAYCLAHRLLAPAEAA